MDTRRDEIEVSLVLLRHVVLYFVGTWYESTFLTWFQSSFLTWSQSNYPNISASHEYPTISASHVWQAEDREMGNGVVVLSGDRHCEDRVLDGPASGEKGSKGRN